MTEFLLAGCGNTAEVVDSDSVVSAEVDADAVDAENAEQDVDEAEAPAWKRSRSNLCR